MANISGTVFLIIGAVVSIISLFMEDLRFFVIVGIAFMLYGGGKLLFSKKKKPVHKLHKHHCPFCNRQVDPRDNFCRACGGYLKHQGGNPNLNHSSHHQNYNRQYNQVRRVP